MFFAVLNRLEIVRVRWFNRLNSKSKRKKKKKTNYENQNFDLFFFSAEIVFFIEILPERVMFRSYHSFSMKYTVLRMPKYKMKSNFKVLTIFSGTHFFLFGDLVIVCPQFYKIYTLTHICINNISLLNLTRITALSAYQKFLKSPRIFGF